MLVAAGVAVGLPAGVWLPIVRGLRDGDVFGFALLDFALLDLGLVGFCALDVGLVGFGVLDFRLAGFSAAAAGAAATGVVGAAPWVTPRDGAAVEMLVRPTLEPDAPSLRSIKMCSQS